VDSGQPIYYVKPSGNDGDAGTSWGTAFSTLQQALTMASAGSQIWVAAGTYKPTATSDRSITFELKNGVAVYGGFAGTETNLSQPYWQTNVTILSGDIDGDAMLANNSYHVVNGSNTFATSVLDGLLSQEEMQTAGKEGENLLLLRLFNSFQSHHQQQLCERFRRRMYNVLGNPSLTNVTFSGNTCGDRGGGVYSERGQPVFLSSSFIGNNAFDGVGCGTGRRFIPATSNAIFTNVVFKNNSTSHFGGGCTRIFESIVQQRCLLPEFIRLRRGLYMLQGSSTLANVTLTRITLRIRSRAAAEACTSG